MIVGGPDVVIGLDKHTGEPVTLRYQDRPRGVAIIGKSGTGKSSVLEQLILADLRHGIPGFVIDPHGLLGSRVISLASPTDTDHIVLLDASESPPFGLNLLACEDPADDRQVTRVSDSVVDTFKKLYGQAHEYIPRLEKYLDLAVRTLIPNRLTLADIARLFTDKQFREACVANVSQLTVGAVLRQRWAQYDRLRDVEQLQQIEAIANRIDRLLAPEFMQEMVRNEVTTVPFNDVLAGKTMVIVSLPSEDLGLSRADIIGALLLCVLAEQVFARRTSVVSSPARFHLYVDEYQRFATETTAQLLTQGRKYAVGATFAHQGRDQIRDVSVSAAELHAGSLVVLQVTSQDAEVLAIELPVFPREEWTEEVDVQDGTEPEMVPTRTPGMSANRHRNPALAAAGRQLFEEAVEGPGQPVYRDTPHVAVSQGDPAINQLLVDVMDGKVTRTEELYVRLLDIAFLFTEAGPSKGARRYSGSLAPRNYYIPFNAGWIPTEIPRVMDRLRSWLNTYLHCLHSSEKIRTTACDEADNELYTYARQQQEAEDSWTHSEKRYSPARGAYTKETVSGFNKGERLEYLQQTVAAMGQRLHALLILCEGLSADPILVDSGQSKARVRTQILLHQRQTEQDARNELAGRLVNPRKRFVAHVKTPDSYFEVRLIAPPDYPLSDHLVRAVRDRSRGYYGARPAASAWVENPPDTPPAIGRRSPAQ